MDRQAVDQVLAHMETEWRRLPEETRPEAMWVALHAPLPDGAQDLLRQGGRPLAVWYLDEQGERPASVSSYVRFMTVLFRQPWCCRLYGERDAFFEGCAYPIGRAAFAPFVQP